MDWSVIQGDIGQQSADALVNAAGTSLRMGSGVAGFDLDAGARSICEEIDAYDPETLGDARFISCGDDEYETVRRVSDEVREG